MSRKILVTGGCGFIGSALVRMLLNENYHVYNIDKGTYAATFCDQNLIDHNKQYKRKIGDICNLSMIADCLDEFQPDAIIHAAAESHVDNSIIEPGKFVQTNIVGTFNMLRAAEAYCNRYGRLNSFRFLHVSSDEVFGSLPHKNKLKFDENSNYKPSSPYSASKAGSDLLVQSWYETYKLPTIITNCSNNYGPWQHKEKLIPTVISRLKKGNKIPVYGDGKNIRDWIYVEDHIDALLLVLKNGKIGERYCIGGETEKTNLEIAKDVYSCLKLKKLAIKLNNYDDIIDFVPDRKGHDLRYAIDNTKIRQLGWKPETQYKLGLEKTIDWYLK